MITPRLSSIMINSTTTTRGTLHVHRITKHETLSKQITNQKLRFKSKFRKNIVRVFLGTPLSYRTNKRILILTRPEMQLLENSQNILPILLRENLRPIQSRNVSSFTHTRFELFYSRGEESENSMNLEHFSVCSAQLQNFLQTLSFPVNGSIYSKVGGRGWLLCLLLLLFRSKRENRKCGIFIIPWVMSTAVKPLVLLYVHRQLVFLYFDITSRCPTDISLPAPLPINMQWGRQKY